MKNKIVRKVLISGIIFSVFPLFGLFSALKDSVMPHINPKYVLVQDETKNVLEDNVWYYYPVTGNYSADFQNHYVHEYAVALKNPMSYMGPNDDGKIDVPTSFKITVTAGGNTIGGNTDAGIVGIWHNAFQESPATEITLHPGLAVIDFEAFLYSGITAIEIPYTVTAIGDAAFYACAKLKSARIVNSSKGGTDEAITCACPYNDDDDEEDEGGGESSQSSSVASNRFGDGPFVKNVTVVTEGQDLVYYSDLKKIPSFCFFDCYNLVDLSLNSAIEEVEWEAFNGCAKLNSSIYFRKIKIIRARAFQGCTSLPFVYISNTLFGSIDDTAEGHPISDYGIIEPHAFNYCGNNIHFQFNGIQTTDQTTNSVTKWLAVTDNQGFDNSKWGLYSDTSDVTYNSTTHRDISWAAEPTSTSDWEFTTYDEKMGGVSISNYIGRKPTTSDSTTSDWVNGYLMVPKTDGQGHKVVMLKKGALDSVKDLIYRLYLPTTLKAIDNQFFDDGFTKLAIIDERSQVCTDQDLLKNAEGKYDNALATRLTRRIDLHRLVNLQFIGGKAFTCLGCAKDLKINKNQDGTYNSTTLVDPANSGHGIELVRLPYNLIAIGDEAFSRYTKDTNHTDNDRDPGRFQKVKRLIWDYRNTVMNANHEVISGSRLEAIGKDAFFKFGWNTSSQDFNGQPDYKDCTPSTLILPKTFKYFGILNRAKNPNDGVEDLSKNPTSDGYGGHGPNDVYRYWNTYGFRFLVAAKNTRPAHAFAGCPLIGKVIIKGGDEAETSDLYIPLLVFAFCSNLQTLVVEERVNHYVTVHTQGAAYDQTSCGSNGSKSKSDFRADPSLQTIVLPNKYTTLRVQPIAFQGCSRAAIYLSGNAPGTKINNEDKDRIIANTANGAYDKRDFQWTALFDGTTGDNADQNLAYNWDAIGDEQYFPRGNENNYKGYMGYAFVSDTGEGNAFTNSAYLQSELDKYGTFSLNQRIPIYANVHYKEVVKEEYTDTVTVEVGEARTVGGTSYAVSTNKFTVYNKCAYVCNTSTGKATMSKFFYNLRTGSGDTADVAGTVKAVIPDNTDASASYYGGDSTTDYTVNKIGDSAFSAAFCNGASAKTKVTDVKTGADIGNKKVSGELTTVVVPDSIEEIGDYAFLRAYGVENFGVKRTGANDSVWYEMPADLKWIGKNAFTFCNIKEFLNIPYECIFYENTEECLDERIQVRKSDMTIDKTKDVSYMISSAFSNNLSLRKITFRDSSGNKGKTASKYYSTAEYAITAPDEEHGIISETYTTSLYSNAHPQGTPLTYTRGGATKGFQKDNRLLLVLNRDADHKFKTDIWEDSEHSTIVTTSGSGNAQRVRFDGERTSSEKPFLYGAYRMAFWVDDLETGPATKNNDAGTPISQPLFAAVCKRTNNDSSATVQDSYIYLHIPIRDFAGNAKDLRKFTGDIFDQAAQSFRGCNKLEEVKLRNRKQTETGSLDLQPGLFDSIESTVKYRADSDTTQDKGLIDLTNTGYNSIGAETFQGNTSITKLIAPATGTYNGSFTIGQSAFAGCTSLTTLDFSQMTGNLILGKEAFKGSGVVKIKWPTSGKVILGQGAFQNCAALKGSTDDLTTTPSSLVIPYNVGDSATSDTNTIPNSCFAGCTGLTTVTAEQGDETHPITGFAQSAFEGCTNITNFDFGAFGGLTTISSRAFYNTGALSNTNNGTVVIPSHVTTFGESAFETSRLTHINFQCNSISLGARAFADCDSLTGVHFKNSSCTWTDGNGNTYNEDVFGYCGELKELQLPRTFPLIYNCGGFVTKSNASLKFYLHSKSYGTSPDGAWSTAWDTAITPYWLVETNTDIPNDISPDKTFWKKGDSDGLVCGTYLGSATVSGTTITFSDSTWYLDNGTWRDSSPNPGSRIRPRFAAGALERTLL